MTDEERSTRGFFDHVANQWDASGDAEVLRKSLDPLVARFDIPTGGVVLDVGTGTGVLHPWLLDAVGTSGRVLAFDFSRRMLGQALLKRASQNLACFQADVTAIPLAGQSCDRVVCFSAFPHFPDKLQALQEMARVARDGGRVFIAHLMSRHQIAWHHHACPDVADHCLPLHEEMEGLFSKAGLKSITIQDEPGLYFAQGVKGSGKH